MSLFDELLTASSLSEVRAIIVGYAQGAQLPITSWTVGDVGQQIVEVVTHLGHAVDSVRARVVRGFASLDTATDPGDPDAYDANNVNLPPEKGALSNYGENVCGTVRGEQTFATGPVTFVNAGVSARTFKPYALVFTWTANSPPPVPKTYRNAPDATIYTNPDGSVTVPAGTSLTIPVVAEERGTDSNTPANSLSLTTTLIGCSATNGSAVLAVDREDAETYRLRCRQASARLSFGAPADAIAYLAVKTLDGQPLTNASGNAVNISRVDVSRDSATGIVDAYYASPSGAAISEDVDAANENIETNAYAVMDCVTFTGAAASEVNISVVGTASIEARPGLPTESELAAIIAAAIVEAFKAFPIGGKDKSGGSGRIYTGDIRTVAANAYPGFYNVAVTTPAGAFTTLATGEVAITDVDATDWTVTIVS